MSALDVIPLPGHEGMFARRVAVDVWERAGSPRVNSAGRLYALQKYFWDGWRKHLTGFNPADNPDDESQRLAHVRFVAFDIDPTPDRTRRLEAAGMVRPYWYEPWHWELPNVHSYDLVRSIPATAAGGSTPIVEREEAHMRPIRQGTAGQTFYNGVALIGELSFELSSGGGDADEWGRVWNRKSGDIDVVTATEFRNALAGVNRRRVLHGLPPLKTDTGKLTAPISTGGGVIDPAPIVDAARTGAEAGVKTLKVPTVAEVVSGLSAWFTRK